MYYPGSILNQPFIEYDPFSIVYSSGASLKDSGFQAASGKGTFCDDFIFFLDFNHVISDTCYSDIRNHRCGPFSPLVNKTQ